MANRYPDNLMKHLRELGDANDLTLGNFDVASKWQFTRTCDNGEANENCPCGKHGIRYLMYIKHTNTGNDTFVGSQCITIFEERLQKVMEVAFALMSRGVQGKFLGVTTRNPPKLRFEISGNHGLVKNKSDFKLYFDHVPVHQVSSKWECCVFPPNRAAVNAYVATLQDGGSYSLKLKLSRWSQSYGTGFSLDIIECTAITN